MNKSHVEIERKYIILIPDVRKLVAEENYSKLEIMQVYLESEDNITHRVRRVKDEKGLSFFETKKMRIDAISAYEDEREITESEFLKSEKNIKRGTRPIIKTRHRFVYHDQTFEIDVYPEWKNSCIMETELDSKDKEVKFPSFIKILAEVTGNNSYSNASMSKIFPKELI